jgi:ParB family chromosome partitioning protein
VAGERRYRASRLAGLSTIPCIVRNMTNVQQMEAALIENLQREDLNPIEEAAAIRSLMNECNYTQEEAAKRLGKSRPAIANALRLLNLPDAITAMVIGGELSAGHARVLAGLDSEERQLALANECIQQGYSVRKLEEAAKETPEKAAAPKKAQAPKALSPELNAFQDAMREVLGVKTVLTGNGQKGKITISYNSADELEGIFQAVSKLLL